MVNTFNLDIVVIFTMVLICSSLIANDIEQSHVLIGHWFILICKCPFTCFALFCCLSFCELKALINILNTNPWPVTSLSCFFFHLFLLVEG